MVFQEEIAKGTLLTMKEVRDRMRGHLYLRKFVIHAAFVKKVADFVRYNTNTTRQM